ncbi:TetR/AcrR family transcriptional regulator [Noviherbaspirillum saxi]|nr:TetR/AcrR family transcriptional regulator [Noviherbaspirillum saxi]
MANRDSKAAQERPSLRQEQKRLTYERLLASAIEVFEETGYRAATIAQIAQHAGADRTTFYLHFKNKSDVATGIARRHTSATAKHFHALDNLSNPSLKDVRAWVKLIFNYWTGFSTELEVLCEAIASDAELSSLTADYNAHLANIVTRNSSHGMSAKERRIMRAKAMLLISTQRDAMFSILCRKQTAISLNHIVDALASLWWECLYQHVSATDTKKN